MQRIKSYTRRWLWRLGRKLYRIARNEPANDPRINGEYALQARLVSYLLQTKCPNIADIGSNKGEWTMSFIEKISRNQMENPTQFFLFEPVLQLIQYSERHIHQSQSIRVSFQNVLVSDSSGQASLAISNIDPMAGTHSVVSESANRTDYTILEVPTVSLDAFSERHGIESFFFVKIDTEGHDFSVIKGCGQQLRRGKIDFLQFEYNHRWVYSRTYLRDVFEFIAGLDYHLGKLVSDGVELIDCWHPELEIFFETNFVLIRKGLEQIANAQSGGFDKFNTFGLKH